MYFSQDKTIIFKYKKVNCSENRLEITNYGSSD